MESANEAVTLIGNIVGCVCILAFIVGTGCTPLPDSDQKAGQRRL